MAPEEHAAMIAERRARNEKALAEAKLRDELMADEIKAETKRQLRLASKGLGERGVVLLVEAASEISVRIVLDGEPLVFDGSGPRRVGNDKIVLGGVV